MHTESERTLTLIAHLDPKSPVAEAYRTLRTNLQFSALDRPLRTILFTSAGPAEGKSTIAANLSATMAQAGQRVIVVGADLRKPTLHNIFGATNRVGLTNVLSGHVSLEQAVVNTPVPGLALLSSGPIPPNPSELLGSKAMSKVLAALAGAYDMVVIDSPPVLAVADASVLAPQVDGVIMVLDAGAVPREIAQRAKHQLTAVHANILGVVINRVTHSDSYGYYYYYYSSTDDGSVKQPKRRATVPRAEVAATTDAGASE